MNRKRTALSIGICFLCLVLLSLYHLPAASGSGSRKPQNFDRQAPSLEQQIAHEHVKTGSVLERVIKENQQFYMLDAEEFTDSLPYPLWLRVYWRKAHPEMRYQPTDTTGGYPRHMKRLYDWMVGNQNSVNLLSAQAMTNEKYPPWPTLEQQLAESEVKPGSKLEALIKANQDFSLLRPEEAGDTLRIPYWLRVIHRKAHPEVKHSAQDASGGYPFVLKEAHEWMMEHQDLQTGKPEPFVAPNKTVTPGLELRVSGTQTARRSESDIRINYWDTNKIISASNNIGGSGLQGQYFSTDNGVTWGQTTLPVGPSPDSFDSDPTVDWTSDGTAWSSTLGINSGGSSLSLRNFRSSDNGATWTFEATASGSQTNVDKQMVWVDHSATSAFKDQQYAIWHNGAPVFMNRRTAGGGGTWGTPIQV
ncbi:MAG TPA: sialidase family protein, partial [Acidobacteriota bacterium]|nr:sialidase family protein [Acidobacteriota bacterium]